MSDLYDLYLAVGNEGFGVEVANIAPYFGTIDPQFVALRPGYCEIRIKNTRELHNHLGCIHAIAMCNGAELVAGLMTDVSIPSSHRWIPVNMVVNYLKKANTDLRVVAQGASIDWTILGSLVVPVDVFNDTQEKVMTAEIIMKLSEKAS